MTSVQLATMSTALWVVATVSLFVLLAEWSTGGSWGLTGSIVRGVRGWANDEPPAPPVSSPFAESLPPLLVPRRPIGGVAAARLRSADQPTGPDIDMTVDIVELGERRLPR